MGEGGRDKDWVGEWGKDGKRNGDEGMGSDGRGNGEWIVLRWEGVGIEREVGRRKGIGKAGVVEEDEVRMEERVWRREGVGIERGVMKEDGVGMEGRSWKEKGKDGMGNVER